MTPVSAPRALLVGLCWCLSLRTSCGLLVPTPQGDVFTASHTRLRRVPPPLPATSPVTSTSAVAPPASRIETGDGGGDGIAGVAPRAERPSSKDFGKFVERRQAELGRVVIDLRPSSEFQREHFVGATSIPAGELEARLLELPPPFAQPLSIVGDEEVRAPWLELYHSSVIPRVLLLRPLLHIRKSGTSTRYLRTHLRGATAVRRRVQSPTLLRGPIGMGTRDGPTDHVTPFVHTPRLVLSTCSLPHDNSTSWRAANR